MPNEQRPLKVFLSYASQDKPIVRELSRRLVGEGWIDTWLDETSLLPGQDWRLKIEEAVEDSDIVIICLSSNSVTKEGYVQKELRYAREIALEKPEDIIFLIPLRLDDCIIPRGLRFYQRADYFGERKDQAFSALIASLKFRYEQKLGLKEAERFRQGEDRSKREAIEKATRENAEREKAEREGTEKAVDDQRRIYIKEKLRVFISYSHFDKALVAKITSGFNDLHIPYFLDEKGISLDESLQVRVSGGISSCSHLLVIVSPRSHKSQWVPYEIGIAQGLGLTIIPFLTHPSEDPLPFNRDIKYTTDIKKLLQYFRNLLGEGFGKIVPTDPDNDALAFAAHHGHKEVVVGKVMEIWAHHSLETMRPLSEFGIDPSLVTFSHPEKRDYSFSLKQCGGLREFPPPNQRKFGIAKLPLGTTDDENQVIEICETDWNTWMSIRTTIEKSLDLRLELSNVLPELSLVPQSMSLQFLVRFRNGDILAMKRKGGLASEPHKWAFSAEEQLHERDFQRPSTDVAENLFRRSFIEEVLGHRESDPEFLDRIWNEDCSRLVKSHRIWSFFLEENTGIFQMFGVYQLKVEPRELRRFHEVAVSAG